MTNLTVAEALCMALFCSLLGPTLGLSSLQSLNSGRNRRGVPVVGDVLGGVLGGGGKGGGGVLGGVLGGGDKGVVSGVLGGVGGVLNNATGSVLPGGGVPGVGGLLGGGGGKGGGFLGSVLDDVGGLLNDTTNSLLASGLLNGVLDQNQLRDLLGSLNGNLLGLGSGGTKESFQWYNILNLQFIRGSWKIVGGTELILNLQAVIVMKLPVLLFRTVTMDVNITAHLAITQDKPGDLKLVLKNCQNLVAGFTIKMPSSLVATLLTNLMNLAVQNNMPRMLCPIFQIWINVINMKLRILNNYVFFGLLGRIHTALSTIPISTGQFSELDLKDKPFPGFFLNWLLNDINSKVIPKIA
ncbi:BPI fold-containing family B member 4-like isoform X2 [Crotalus tigris]|uniref:BPI fold-containing family B member 4-like isoform X2 n=1 Tax=Crotalus tigris TaxID=88082 RepID=UPI00192F5FCB|nr:BPI fold-containing family B member 4-like isoform X2 [Crotalus tigris]XP_039224144.1 BPI fold-containing family B member 4-like isoform X2 [Crotalus tigris]